MNNLNILVVDDDNGMVFTTSYILRDLNHHVITARNGAQALGIIMENINSSQVIDLLITDIRMPIMDGLELIKHIKDDHIDIPIIAMTGFEEKEILIELIRLGCDNFLSKPFGADDLRKVLCEALEKYQATRYRYERQQKELLEKTINLERDVDAYRHSFECLQKEVHKAVNTYQDLITIKKQAFKVPFSFKYQPYKDLGGDYIDIRDTETGCDILIADVAGHDLSASYHTILLKNFFDENCRNQNDGETFFYFLNHALMKNGANDRMVTALFIRFHLEKNQIDIVSAGHPKLIRVKNELRVSAPINISGDVLGLQKNVHFDRIVLNVSAGDTFFLYTDGVINAYYINGLSGKRFTLGVSGLCDIINEHAERDIYALVNNVWQAVLSFCSYKTTDDMIFAGFQIPWFET